MKDLTLSDDVVIYVGSETSGGYRFSWTNFSSAQNPSGIERENVERLIREVSEIDVKWSQCDEISTGKMVQDIMAERHPELTHEALEALKLVFYSYWR